MEGRQDDGFAVAMREANAAFGRLGEAVEAVTGERGEDPIDVLEVAKKAGLEIDESVLEHLELPRLIYPLWWCPWHHWFCWRPLWCWWWARFCPYYRCCPYWWHHCHPCCTTDRRFPGTPRERGSGPAPTPIRVQFHLKERTPGELLRRYACVVAPADADRGRSGRPTSRRSAAAFPGAGTAGRQPGRRAHGLLPVHERLGRRPALGLGGATPPPRAGRVARPLGRRVPARAAHGRGRMTVRAEPVAAAVRVLSARAGR